MKKIILIILLFIGVVIYSFINKDNQFTQTTQVIINQESINKNDNSLDLATNQISPKKELKEEKETLVKKELKSSKDNKITLYYEEQLEIIKNKNYLDKEEVTYQDKDDIFINLDGDSKKITDGKGKYYMPLLSPNNNYLIFNEISKGLFVLDINDGSVQNIGAGNNVYCHPDKELIIYDVVHNNDSSGYNIGDADIYVYDLKTNKKNRITNTPNIIESKPIFSEDGKDIYYTNQKTGKINSIKFDIKDKK